MPFKVPLDAKVSDISAGERQKCEILKQLYLKRRFLILDEPTSVLTPGEADEVLGMLRAMVVDGRAHHPDDHPQIPRGDGVCRRGDHPAPRQAGRARPGRRSHARRDGAHHDRRRAVDGAAAARSAKSAKPRLELSKLTALDDAGAVAVHDVSLVVRGGEIVGIAGVSGNGQRQLVEVLAGQREAESGEIRVAGDHYRASREEMRRHKMSLLPEEPLKNACVGAHERRRQHRVPRIRPGAVCQRRLVAQPSALPARTPSARSALYKIKTRTPDTPISALSGGNVQRAVLARELGGEVEVLIAANPCFGLDFAAVAQIHAEIMAARNRGAAVLLVSEDLDELLELSDRLVVMFHGQFVYEARASEADLTEIGRHMAGH